MLTWIVSPESLIRWLKRHQERQAQGEPEEPRRPGRPRVRAEIEQAVLQIYRCQRSLKTDPFVTIRN